MYRYIKISGVVEGDAGKRRSPKYILGDAVPPNDISTRGNDDTVAFDQVGLILFKLHEIRKIIEIVATRCHILSQNAPNSISAEAPPDTPLGRLHSSPYPLAVFKGAYF